MARGRDALFLVSTLACLLGCSATPPPPAASPEPPRDPLAAVLLPGATNADVRPVDDAPLVSIVGKDVLLDGKAVGSVEPILSPGAETDDEKRLASAVRDLRVRQGAVVEPIHSSSPYRMRRIDGLFNGLRDRREAWLVAHGLPPSPPRGVVSMPGVFPGLFPGVVLLAFPQDTMAVVVKSVLQTAAFAGYPHARFLVRMPSGVGRLPVDAQVPGPPGLAAAGGLTPEQVRRVVTAHAGALRACYELEAQREPTLTGGVTTSWQIDPRGAVSGAMIGSSTLNNPRIEACILRQIGSWVFPASDAPTTVGSYPFRFGVTP
jgi:hypothetical protein